MSNPSGGVLVLVLGLGNLLMGDEGVGVHVARWLTEETQLSADGIHVVDGGTLGLDLLPLIEDSDALILIDAAELGAEPGTVRVLLGSELDDAAGGHLSPHQVGLRDLLAVGRLTASLPGRVALVAIQPAKVDVGVELTPECQAAVPTAADAVRAAIETLLVEPTLT